MNFQLLSLRFRPALCRAQQHIMKCRIIALKSFAQLFTISLQSKPSGEFCLPCMSVMYINIHHYCNLENITFTSFLQSNALISNIQTIISVGKSLFEYGKYKC